MNSIDRRALLRGLVSLPATIPAARGLKAATDRQRWQLEGCGVIFMDGMPVFFDSTGGAPAAGERILVKPGALAHSVVSAPGNEPMPGDRIHTFKRNTVFLNTLDLGWPIKIWLESAVIGRVIEGDRP